MLGVGFRDWLACFGIGAIIVGVVYFAGWFMEWYSDPDRTRIETELEPFPRYAVQCGLGHRSTVEIDAETAREFNPANLHCPVCGFEIFSDMSFREV